jgi:hypothetical protein
MKSSTYIFCLLTLSSVLSFAQRMDWERLYSIPGTGEMTYMAIPTYDNGFLMCINVHKENVDQWYSWLLKTDINGNVLWSKFYYDISNSFCINGLDINEEGDIILCGAIEGNSFIMHLNACGEKIWCKYLTRLHSNYGWRVNHLPGRQYIWLTYMASYNWQQEWYQLWKLDSLGNILTCMQIIPKYEYPNLLGPWIDDFIITNDHGYLLNGHCYFPQDTTNPQGSSTLQQMIIKTDSLGTEQWVIPDSINMEHCGALISSVKSGNFYYSSGYTREEAPGWWPYLGKFDTLGNLVYEKSLHFDTLYSITLGLIKQDNSLFQVAQSFYGSSDPIFTGLFKTDTLGNLMKLIENKHGSPGKGDFTESIDNKFLIAGYAPYDYINFDSVDAWAMKVNENLEYDSIYNFPFVYDSLCPFPIPTDTVDCDCDLITEIDQLPGMAKEDRMLISPNPATDRVTITLVHPTGKKNKAGMNVLTMYDLSGREIRSMEIETEIVIDLSGVGAGVYVVSVKAGGISVGWGKLVVIK